MGADERALAPRVEGGSRPGRRSGPGAPLVALGWPLASFPLAFPQAVQLKDDEVIALAWVVYRSKEDRDRISKAVMEDPQLKESMDPSKMPFDGKRMFWGGFQTIVGLAAGQ